MAPIVYNLGIIGGALFLVPVFGVAGLAIGVVARRRGAPPRPGPDAAPHRRADPAAGRPARPAGAARARADGAARARPRRDADRVPGHDQPRLDPADRVDQRLQLRVRDPPDPDRRHRGAAGRRAPAVALARGGDRRRWTRSGACSSAACRMLGVRDDRDHRARHRALGATSSSSCSASSACSRGGARADPADARDLPRRADRPLADRRARPRLLRAPGHRDAGRRRADRGRRQHRRRRPCWSGRSGSNGLAVAIATAAWLETLALVLLLQRRLPALDARARRRA